MKLLLVLAGVESFLQTSAPIPLQASASRHVHESNQQYARRDKTVLKRPRHDGGRPESSDAFGVNTLNSDDCRDDIEDEISDSVFESVAATAALLGTAIPRAIAARPMHVATAASRSRSVWVAKPAKQQLKIRRIGFNKKH